VLERDDQGFDEFQTIVIREIQRGGQDLFGGRVHEISLTKNRTCILSSHTEVCHSQPRCSNLGLFTPTFRPQFLPRHFPREPARIAAHRARTWHAIDSEASNLPGRDKGWLGAEDPSEIPDRAIFRPAPLMPTVCKPAHPQFSRE
jgi:hypothetical protein